MKENFKLKIEPEIKREKSPYRQEWRLIEETSLSTKYKFFLKLM